MGSLLWIFIISAYLYDIGCNRFMTRTKKEEWSSLAVVVGAEIGLYDIIYFVNPSLFNPSVNFNHSAP